MSGDPLICHEMDLVVLTKILKSKIRLIEQKYQCALCIGRVLFYGTSFIDKPKCPGSRCTIVFFVFVYVVYTNLCIYIYRVYFLLQVVVKKNVGEILP